MGLLGTEPDTQGDEGAGPAGTEGPGCRERGFGGGHRKHSFKSSLSLIMAV